MLDKQNGDQESPEWGNSGGCRTQEGAAGLRRGAVQLVPWNPGVRPVETHKTYQTGARHSSNWLVSIWEESVGDYSPSCVEGTSMAFLPYKGHFCRLGCQCSYHISPALIHLLCILQVSGGLNPKAASSNTFCSSVTFLENKTQNRKAWGDG